MDTSKLTSSARVALELWQAKRDVRRLYTRASYYRHRAAIKKHCGVDISLLRDEEHSHTSADEVYSAAWLRGRTDSGEAIKDTLHLPGQKPLFRSAGD